MIRSLKAQDGTRPIQQSLWAGSRNDLVNHILLPGSEKAQMMTDISGRSVLTRCEMFNRTTAFLKTFPALLIGQKGWYSKKCNLIWKLRATKHNRLFFQLQVSVPRTEGTGCGLWPTPDCSDRRSDNSKQWGVSNYARNGLLPTPTAMTEAESKMKSTQQKEGSRHSVGLGSAMAMGLLPTPRANKVNGCNLNSENLASRGKGNLEETVAQWVVGMLPTPAAQDSKNKTFPQSQQNRNSIPGAIMRQGQTGKTSQLNHRFVMEMMGFPPDWCDIYYELAEIAIQKKRQKKKPKG